MLKARATVGLKGRWLSSLLRHPLGQTTYPIIPKHHPCPGHQRHPIFRSTSSNNPTGSHPAQSALGHSSSSSVISSQLSAPAQSALGPSSVSSWTQLSQLLDPAQSALGPSSVSSWTQLSQLLDPAQSALGPSSVSS
ncbi:hypothetical protein PGT21_026197 [Puccinia graminis f. sp. tritici]|uniref:Uncharacterized protein n=1 Tax=Puccinia graminis f. sp. tritici TaxID=56615 RepID=A0A5B0N556_PUCGR|nr:hypothetical protein PGT21_026197 [Puccinia graminis f. sp. tritici]